ncbi:unnamed protein product [Choristocarpus tenellus]
MGHTVGSQHIRGKELTDAVIDVFHNGKVFGGCLVAFAATLVADVANNDPTCVGYLHSSGIAKAYLTALIDSTEYRSSEFIVTIPQVLGSLSLTSTGAEGVKQRNVFPTVS